MNRTAALALCLAAAGCASAGRPSALRLPRPETHLDSLALAALDFAAQQYRRSATTLSPEAGYPRSTKPDGTWYTVPINDWTSGFFPGTLWYLYEHTRDGSLRAQAERWTLPLAAIPQGRYTHDLGFQFLSSFGNAYRITGEERFKEPALNAARLLAARFNPTVGAIKSWDWTDPKRPYPVIVDNMMNLELLFWAAEHGGDQGWKNLAVRHGRTTRANHLRPDGGSFHVVVFDPGTGAALERITHQGLADSTTWARGQAWLTYGFTMAYRETGNPEFLQTARRVADYALSRLPPDHVPCWDYQAPECPTGAKRDASAAAIMASGLLELSGYVPAADGARYRRAAEMMLTTLASPAYLARGTNSRAVLLHGVGHHPAGTEVDVGLAYADYYFVEGLRRYLELRGLRERKLLPRSAAAAEPRVFSLRGELLRQARERVQAGDPRLRPALAQLRRDADAALKAGPFSVMHKQAVPPSGDKHDYMSFGPYWWPDSTKPNGLPYIRRDGEMNPQTRRDSDSPRLTALTEAVEVLGLAYYLTGEERYGESAARLLRTWFLDPATCMNPHLRYGQAIPGRVEGRGIGIIDTRHMSAIVDVIGMIEQSRAWTPEDQRGMRDWMAAYLEWLRTSEHGRDEQDEANNHGTWYDVQVAAMALFIGDTAVARTVLEQSKALRIDSQIAPDGRQPREMARTRSLHYTLENLEGFARLADMGRHVGVDLWRYEGTGGRGLRAALDFVAPYADSQKAWPGEQITDIAPDLPMLALHLRRGMWVYGDNRYAELLRMLPKALAEEHRGALMYPDR